MYIFGEQHSQLNLEQLFDQASIKEREFLDVSIDQILMIFGKLHKLWSSDETYCNRGRTLLAEDYLMSPEDIEISLNIFLSLIDPVSLSERFCADFERTDCFERSVQKSSELSVLYKPLGKVLHVTAGNIFLGAIDSLLMGLLTKNVSLVKLSSSNQSFPLLFAESIKDADEVSIIADKFSILSWKGGDQDIELAMKNHVDCILTWGGEDMVTSYQKDLPSKVKLINHGPKISMHVISLSSFRQGINYQLLAQDITTWEQKACANSQNIFLEAGIDKATFSNGLNQALLGTKKRPSLTSNEYVELLKDAALAEFHEFESGDKNIITDDHQVLFDHSILNPTAQNRSIKLKSFSSLNELAIMLKEFSFYLQTCGLAVSGLEKNNYVKHLSYSGITRFTNIGSMLVGKTGAPHDGSFSLQELTKVISVESDDSVYSFLTEVDAPWYADSHTLDEFKITSGELIKDHPIFASKELLSQNLAPGFIFSSGGTTGDAKFINYSYEEFNQTCKLLADSYKQNGLKSLLPVANMFMSGNMWSSFSAVQNALELCDVTQFPMGGNIQAVDAENIIQNFQIKTIFGLPSLIIQFASECSQLNIDTIFYAGESFTSTQIKFLKEHWGVKAFHSAGYACVDVGPIGYQDATCTGTEHILFHGLHLEVINDEAVITSTIRKNMPVIRYRTGDKVRILESRQGEVRFELLGRVDSLINIWSSRFTVEEIQKSLKELNAEVEVQVVLTTMSLKEKILDKMEVRLNIELEHADLNLYLYTKLSDLSNTHSYDSIAGNITIHKTDFEYAEKTGKLKSLIDLR